jgi:hypothetical protein
MRNNRDTVRKNTETLIHASKEVGLKINAEKTKYMLLSSPHNIGHNRDMKEQTDRLKMCHS